MKHPRILVRALLCALSIGLSFSLLSVAQENVDSIRLELYLRHHTGQSLLQKAAEGEWTGFVAVRFIPGEKRIVLEGPASKVEALRARILLLDTAPRRVTYRFALVKATNRPNPGLSTGVVQPPQAAPVREVMGEKQVELLEGEESGFDLGQSGDSVRVEFQSGQVEDGDIAVKDCRLTISPEQLRVETSETNSESTSAPRSLNKKGQFTLRARLPNEVKTVFLLPRTTLTQNETVMLELRAKVLPADPEEGQTSSEVPR